MESTFFEQFLEIAAKFISEFGLPTFLVLYLLFSFSKKIDKMICLLDRLTGVIIKMVDIDRSYFDDE